MDYLVRMPTEKEWDRLVALTAGDDSLIHWYGMGTWCLDQNEHNPSEKLVRGAESDQTRGYCGADEKYSDVGFRPVFVPRVPDRAAEGTMINVGTLFMDGRPVRVPEKPTLVGGDVARYTPGAKLEVKAPVHNEKCQIWAIKVGDAYIADRCVLSFMSWQDLIDNGFGYQPGPPQATLPDRELYLRLAEMDVPMHWRKMYSWVSDVGLRVGFLRKDFFAESRPCTSSELIGFRPMFPGRPEIPDGVLLPAETLCVNDNPIKIPSNPVWDGDIPNFHRGSRIEFREPLKDPKYQIMAYSIGGKLIADRCVLKNISWDDAKELFG